MNGVAQLEIVPTMKEAWSRVYGSKWVIFLAITICIIAQSIIQAIIGNAEPIRAMIGGVLSMFLLLPAFAGLLYLGLQRARGLPIKISQLFHLYQLRFLVNIWIYYVCFYLLLLIIFFIFSLLSEIPVINLIAFAVFIVLALYITARLSQGIYLIFDKNESVIVAFKHSYRITKSYVWQLVLAYFIVMLASIFSILTLGIAMIWLLPFSYIFLGVIYQKIIDDENGKILTM